MGGSGRDSASDVEGAGPIEVKSEPCTREPNGGPEIPDSCGGAIGIGVDEKPGVPNEGSRDTS